MRVLQSRLSNEGIPAGEGYNLTLPITAAEYKAIYDIALGKGYTAAEVARHVFSEGLSEYLDKAQQDVPPTPAVEVEASSSNGHDDGGHHHGNGHRKSMRIGSLTDGFTTREVGRRLGLHPSYISQMINKGKLKARKVQTGIGFHGYEYRVSPAEVVKLQRSREMSNGG